MTRTPVAVGDSYLLPNSTKHGEPTGIVIVQCANRGDMLPQVEFHYNDAGEVAIDLLELLTRHSKVCILDYTK